jgi:hypothetical protein
MCFHAVPDVSGVKPFSTICFVKVRDTAKLSSKAMECHWIVFNATSNGYCVYWPAHHRISVERDVIFSNRELLLLEGEDYSLDEQKSDNEQDSDALSKVSNEHDDSNNSIPPIPRRFSCICTIHSNFAITGDEVDEADYILEANLEAAHSDALAFDPRDH